MEVQEFVERNLLSHLLSILLYLHALLHYGNLLLLLRLREVGVQTWLEIGEGFVDVCWKNCCWDRCVVSCTTLVCSFFPFSWCRSLVVESERGRRGGKRKLFHQSIRTSSDQLPPSPSTSTFLGIAVVYRNEDEQPERRVARSSLVVVPNSLDSDSASLGP